MSKFYHPGRWYYDPAVRGLRHSKPGYYEECEIIADYDKQLTYEEIHHGLIEALEEGGFLKPRLDERLRTEDLKITHRLMDLLDKAISR